jgi:hypothetical protein
MCMLRWLRVRTAHRAVSVDVKALRGPENLSVSSYSGEDEVFIYLWNALYKV